VLYNGSRLRKLLHSQVSFSFFLIILQLTLPSTDDSEIQGQISSTTIPYDYLVYAVGAETQTFGIPGVKENACFMKELHDADKVRQRFLLPLPIY
jgi:NADH dehydrogenase FAD-containing subunit